ncbi:hypothetical protein PsYK624_107350 [Phanerochaete sordida]|uniref:DUF6593 domain-containing protein n=1 Tax=Phanerochaete sordida TaxID=48140 RepID=A0A9P3GGK2_9APHY|nr:hypothetical protein PsYK624_107350 [Phanerochaete sordida]
MASSEEEITTLTFTPDNCCNTVITSSSGEVLYRVATDAAVKHPVTLVHDGAGELVASLEWHDVSSDKVVLKGQKPVSFNDWVKKNHIPFTEPRSRTAKAANTSGRASGRAAATARRRRPLQDRHRALHAQLPHAEPRRRGRARAAHAGRAAAHRARGRRAAARRAHAALPGEAAPPRHGRPRAGRERRARAGRRARGGGGRGAWVERCVGRVRALGAPSAAGGLWANARVRV